jgi:hypothetical protein
MIKEKTIVIEIGRDKGKRFLITEMPVEQADSWAMRALFAMGNGGGDLGIDPRMGMAGMIGIALEALTKVKPEDGIPLLNELLGCVQIIPSDGVARPLNTAIGDVADFPTLWKLRKEVLTLHTDFLQGVFGHLIQAAESPSQESLSTPT